MNALPNMTPAQRQARVAYKQGIILRFLREEIYSTAPVLATLLGLSERQTRQTLDSMQRSELLTSKYLATYSGWAPTLWGITPHGQAMACEAGQFPAEKHFLPARVPLSILRHTLGLQRLRAQAMHAGWTDWQSGDRMAEFEAESRPDAVASDARGVRWCVEYERTMKTRTRYQRILFTRLRAIKAGAYAQVVWVCDTQHAAGLLRGMLLSLDNFEIKHAGGKQRVVVDPSRHHPLLHFTSIDQFPNLPTQGE